jgi:hypothetical protein
MNVDIGQSVTLDGNQLAVITGIPVDELSQKPGHMFSWGKGRFRLHSVDGKHGTITRLSGCDADSDRGTEPGLQRPGADVTDDILSPPTRTMTLGPLELKVMQPGVEQGGGTIEENDVFPEQKPEDKMVHVWIMRSPQLNEPKDLGRTMSSRETQARFILSRMLGFDKQTRKVNMNEALNILIGTK